MNLETRKIEFIKKFLRLQNEEAILHLEKMLKEVVRVKDSKNSESMTQEELNKRIDQSESDFENGRFKSGSELLAKYD